MAENSSGGSWKWFLVGAVLVLAVVGFALYRHHRAEPLSFRTETVSRGEVTQAVTATGTLNPVTSVQVGCQVSGTIQTNYVDFNSQVKAGQLISQIDPRVYQAQVAQAEADLANATANLELQQVQARRSAELYTNRLVSASDNDTAIATLHQAEAMVKIKQASLDNARASLGYTKIYSPVDGMVISRAVDIGQTVAASFNTPTLFQIANDLTKMQIDAAVAEADVGGVVEGQEVEFTVDAYPTRTFHGKVTQVRNSPTTVNNVVTYDAVICVTNSDYKLKPGMTANVSIIIAQRDNAMKIPNAALRYRPPDSAVLLTNELVNLPSATNAPAGGKSHSKGRGNTRTVYFVAGDERAPALKPVQVKIGITDGIATEIIDGLKEGDKVVSGSTGGDAQNSASSNPFGGGFPRMR
jgi:HlyD family secretion protein